MSQSSFLKRAFFALSVALFPFLAIGQDTEFKLPPELEATILKLDANFWQTYNSCDLEKFKTFLTEDVEFYHDRVGLTTTATKLVEQVANGVCDNPDLQLRREAVEGSVNVFPLNQYGAIISGEHIFYLKEADKQEKLIEKARFTHVWKLENEHWQMSRVLSFDHQRISENSNKESIAHSPEILASFVGTYEAPQTGKVIISLSSQNTLQIDAGQMKAELHPETETVFFIKEAPITLTFVKDEQGESVKFVVREQGKVVEEAKKAL